MRNWRDSPSALPRRKFSTICGENTTTQQAMEMDLPATEKVSAMSVAREGKGREGRLARRCRI